MYICIYVYFYMYVYTYVCIYVCMYVCMYVYVCMGGSAAAQTEHKHDSHAQTSIKMSKRTSRRTANSSHYKWRISGTLNGEALNRRYLSIKAFLDEYGGDRTPLQLDRHKMKRFRYQQQRDPRWSLQVIAIKEPRKKTVVYVDY